MVRDLTQLIPGVTAVRVKYPGVNGPDRYKGGIVREVLATQFTYIPGGGLWPEFVRADDEWEIIDE